MERPPLSISAGQVLATTAQRDVTFQIPAVLSERLDHLVTSLERNGPDAEGNVVTQRTTTRKELLAALIFNASPDPGKLEAMLEAYRSASAGAGCIPRKKRGKIYLSGRSPGLRLTSVQEQQRQEGTPPPRRNRYSTLGGNPQ